jgi:hypothetical protein
MATAVRTGETLTQPCAWPTFESIDDVGRNARQAIDEARRWSEHVAAGTVREVRRRPLVAVGAAAAAGLFTGCAFGLAAAWAWYRR